MTDIYTRLGARPVINASGNTTIWGGSTPSPTVQRAMDEANGYWVEMEELLEKSGELIAEALGVEAAYPTSGCFSALVLSTAALMTGSDPEKMAQIPDTTGLKNEFVFQEAQSYGYDRAYSVPGGILMKVGDENGCTVEEMEAAIGPSTAAIVYFVNRTDPDTVVSYDDAARLAGDHGLPILADCAAQIYPIDYFLENAQKADLACFGGKYMGAPHSTGFLCGRKDLVDAAVGHGFIAPGKPFGRAMKMDRQEIVGLVTAVSEWFAMDHEERLLIAGGKLGIIEDAVSGLDSVAATSTVASDNYMAISLNVTLDTKALGKDAPGVIEALGEMTPRIRADAAGDDTIVLVAHNINDGEPEIVAESLRTALSG
ncbi:MAG: hypothetical protein OXD46_10875 [Chloroflexi bacterium]|nr:hypothetical protein [Chloroflexota bacterium]